MGLKVEFVRYRNALCATILEQGDEIKRGDFKFEHNGYALGSNKYPDLNYMWFYLRGQKTEKDNSVCSYTYATKEQAKEALQGFKAAIEAYNASLAPEREQQATDMETVIVG